ncbi:DODA-type extradiol aromatic ring-opening family dioxygenase [Marinomonas mediterranea]|uniref:DODA-type extradiol aromatic ring-opening family dioxygenase n=1 Tax=Marinomonas mediterranea TaxID=119864 RepID=UPI002349A322|nr:class III extradiol ring-cleavage dioxygenase [Marinomonas mediterranea]WCN11365.1 dioxygenase [Marinomonas mediterranea]WCN12552.1 dioxygenase [Marinomonas mediterranea]
MSNIAFVSHGGGPLPVLGDPAHTELVNTLKSLSTELPAKPSVIVVVSAHWETDGFEITASAQPDLLYDYYGFPDESYKLTYPALGAPELAQELTNKLSKNGIKARLNKVRGYDHGVFIPLMLMYPDASIPVLEVSVDNTLDPELHWKMGEELGRALPDDALIIGSGFSFHNMRAFFSPKTGSFKSVVNHFQTWLDDTITQESFSIEDVKERWKGWADIDGGRFCHPREEHLIPAIVCHGAAQKQGSAIPFEALGVEARHFKW